MMRRGAGDQDFTSPRVHQSADDSRQGRPQEASLGFFVDALIIDGTSVVL